MKAWETIAKENGPGGIVLELARRDGDYVIRAGGRDLMTSRQHASEEALATIGCSDLSTRSPHVLIGGLGMGYTLRAALDLLPSTASVVVAEISSAVITWARTALRDLAGDPCADPRAHIERTDVSALIVSAARSRRFDAILLDVDNGPEAIVSKKNALLYTERGLASAALALSAHGTLAIWSASDAIRLERAMTSAGFDVVAHRVGNATIGVGDPAKKKANRGRRHVIIVGKKRA